MPLDVALPPEAEDLDEDFFSRRGVRQLEVRHPDAVGQVDRMRVDGDDPALHLRGEAVGEHLQLRRRVDAEIRQVRAQAVRGREREVLLLALRSPAHARLQVERLAVQEAWAGRAPVAGRTSASRRRATAGRRACSVYELPAVSWIVQMSRWNFTARNSCRKRAGVSPQTRDLHRRAAEQNRLSQRDVVAVEQVLGLMSSNVCTRCSSFRSANRLRSICSGVSVSESAPAISLKHRHAVERRAGLRGLGAVLRGGLEHRLAEFVRRVIGRDLELAAVFEQLRQPGWEAARAALRG